MVINIRSAREREIGITKERIRATDNFAAAVMQWH